MGSYLPPCLCPLYPSLPYSCIAHLTPHCTDLFSHLQHHPSHVEYSQQVDFSSLPPEPEPIKCRTPLSHNTFHSYELPTTNRFDSLSTIPGDDSVFMYSPVSLSSPGMPRWHSSPYSSRGSKNRSSMSRDDNGSRTLPRKNHNNLRISIINCNGIRSRKAELEYLTEYIKPDILLITETKIDKSISSSEFLPANFSYNIRKDRT